MIKETKIFLEKMFYYDITTLHRYAKTSAPFIIYLAINYFIASTILILTPLLSENKKFPVDGWYPFSQSKLITVVIYIQQVIAIITGISNTVLDFVAITLLWSTAARFELLQNDFRSVSSEIQLKFSIRKHQRLLR